MGCFLQVFPATVLDKAGGCVQSWVGALTALLRPRPGSSPAPRPSPDSQRRRTGRRELMRSVLQPTLARDVPVLYQRGGVVTPQHAPNQHHHRGHCAPHRGFRLVLNRPPGHRWTPRLAGNLSHALGSSCVYGHWDTTLSSRPQSPMPRKSQGRTARWCDFDPETLTHLMRTLF